MAQAAIRIACAVPTLGPTGRNGEPGAVVEFLKDIFDAMRFSKRAPMIS